MAPAPSGSGEQQTDPDAGLTLPDGTPVSIAKRLIRLHEPGSQGYNAAFGQHGLPADYKTDAYGFPIWGGNPVGNMYGGRFAGQNSRAAGMFQFEPGTWKNAVLGLRQEGVNITDFSPKSQETVATYLLQHEGMGPWAPWNHLLSADYNRYKQTGFVPEGGYGQPGMVPPAGPYMTGDRVDDSGYNIGGALAFAPPRPSQVSDGQPQVAGGPAVNTGGEAGAGPAGDPNSQRVKDISDNFANSQAEGGLGGMSPGMQALYLLGATSRFHITPVSYDPFKNIPHGRPSNPESMDPAAYGGGSEMARIRPREVPGYLWYNTPSATRFG
jgi:hypothetical protein